ncbi:hypothetical protein [Halobacillus trueperi]
MSTPKRMQLVIPFLTIMMVLVFNSTSDGGKEVSEGENGIER